MPAKNTKKCPQYLSRGPPATSSTKSRSSAGQSVKILTSGGLKMPILSNSLVSLSTSTLIEEFQSSSSKKASKLSSNSNLI